MMADGIFDDYEQELRNLHAYKDGLVDGARFTPEDWDALFSHEPHSEWLVEDIWPMGRSVHLHAQRKTGKSLLALWMAANIAIGRNPFTGESQEPKKVGYYDHEMTEDDLLERVQDMGFTPETLKNLNYYLHPPVPALDTPEGGKALLENAIAHDEQVIVIDTMARVTEGDENSNDTYIRFYRYTGAPLKASGISLLRLDHEGHEGGRSRGASAKADDVDVVWQLRTVENGLQFIRKAARISWVPESVTVKMNVEPLAFTRTKGSWPEGTKDKADELDALEAPLDISRRKAAQMLKDKGYVVGNTQTLNAALKYRRERILWP